MSQEEINKQNGELIERKKRLKEQALAQKRRLLNLSAAHQHWGTFLSAIAEQPERDISPIWPADVTNLDEHRKAVWEYVATAKELREISDELAEWGC